MAGFSVVSAQNVFTIADGTDTGKLIGSIAELQVKRMLVNNNFFESSFRNTLTAEQVTKIGGIATAIYRFAKRVVWGTKYDFETGANRKRTGGDYTTLRVGKFLNVKLMIEEYDLQLFQTSAPNVQAELVGQWIGSLTMNLVMNKEMIFKEAVKTWAIAHYNASDAVPSVYVANFSKLTTKEEIETWEMGLLVLMTKRMKTINEYTVGLNMSEFNVSFSYELYNQMLKAFTQFIDGIGAKTLTGGTWYENSVLGFPFQKDITLNVEFIKGTETELNDDISFSTMGVHGIISHTSDWAHPDGLEYIKQVLDPNTGNLQWIGKYLTSLPMSLRFLTTIIMDHEPTPEEVAQAKALCVPVDSDMGAPDDLETYRCQLSLMDPLKKDSNPDVPVALSTVITTTALGEIAEQTADAILSATVLKNQSLIISECEVSDMTETGATIKAKTGSTKYTGSVAVTYTISALKQTLKAQDKELNELRKQLEKALKATNTTEEKPEEKSSN